MAAQTLARQPASHKAVRIHVHIDPDRGWDIDRLEPGGITERKHYIGDFAVVTETDDGVNPVAVVTDYLLRDHLGSLDVITDEQGVLVRKMSFDAGITVTGNYGNYGDSALNSI